MTQIGVVLLLLFHLCVAGASDYRVRTPWHTVVPVEAP